MSPLRLRCTGSHDAEDGNEAPQVVMKHEQELCPRVSGKLQLTNRTGRATQVATNTTCALIKGAVTNST